MRYNEFKNKTQHWPIIFSRDLTLHQTDKQAIRNQIKRWHQKKLLIKLKRGVFLLNQNDRRVNPSRTYIANQLFNPSYISLEYALGYYNLIPERVSDVTSVTTRKTLCLKNEIGVFVYQHIKPQAYRGFEATKDEAGLTFFLATPEKALVDFCYLNLEKFKGDYEEIFKEFYRLQHMDILNTAKVAHFVNLFNNNKLARVTRALCDLIKKEKGNKR